MKQHISILAALICGIAQAAPQVTFAPAPDGSYLLLYDLLRGIRDERSC